MRNVAVIAGMFLLTGCGDLFEVEKEKVVEVAPPLSLTDTVQSMEDLPECNEGNLDKAVNVYSESRTYHCSSYGWRPLDKRERYRKALLPSKWISDCGTTDTFEEGKAQPVKSIHWKIEMHFFESDEFFFVETTYKDKDCTEELSANVYNEQFEIDRETPALIFLKDSKIDRDNEMGIDMSLLMQAEVLGVEPKIQIYAYDGSYELFENDHLYRQLVLYPLTSVEDDEKSN